MLIAGGTTFHYDTTSPPGWVIQTGVDTIGRFQNAPAPTIDKRFSVYSHGLDSLVTFIAPPGTNSTQDGLSFYHKVGSTWVGGSLWYAEPVPITWPTYPMSFSPMGDIVVSQRGMWGVMKDVVYQQIAPTAAPPTVIVSLSPAVKIIGGRISEDGTEVGIMTVWDTVNTYCDIQWRNIRTGQLTGTWWNLGKCLPGTLWQVPTSPDIVAAAGGGGSRPLFERATGPADGPRTKFVRPARRITGARVYSRAPRPNAASIRRQ
jgi:hypothetical protein